MEGADAIVTIFAVLVGGALTIAATLVAEAVKTRAASREKREEAFFELMAAMRDRHRWIEADDEDSVRARTEAELRVSTAISRVRVAGGRQAAHLVDAIRYLTRWSTDELASQRGTHAIDVLAMALPTWIDRSRAAEPLAPRIVDAYRERLSLWLVPLAEHTDESGGWEDLIP